MIPRVNPIADVTDWSALQDDLADMLLNHDPLRKIAVTQERKFLLDSSMAIDALWMTPRNEGTGTGIIVEDIRPAVGSKSDGQVCDLICGIVILAERNLAMTPDVGCLMHPEQVEAILFALLSRKIIQPYGQLRVEGTFAGPANDWIDVNDSGIYARRITFKLLNAPIQVVTCDPIIMTNDVGTITISGPALDGLQIFYTIDGSFPGSDTTLYPNSTLYTEPFAVVDPGTIVRAIAYAPGFNMSALIQKVIS